MPSDDPSTRFNFALPASLNIEQQIVICIGQLIAEWANAESVLRTIFVMLTGGNSRQAVEFAELSWLSQSNNKGRCDLLRRCAQASDWPKIYKNEINLLIDRFKNASNAQNFYTHGMFVVDPKDMSLIRINSHRLTLDENFVVITSKIANKATVNELTQAIQQCGNLNQEMVGFLLERFPLSLNRMGFPFGSRSDSVRFVQVTGREDG